MSIAEPETRGDRWVGRSLKRKEDPRLITGRAGYVDVNTPVHWPLATEEVKHVGDPVAVVFGDDRMAVVDAAEDVLVEYEPLDADRIASAAGQAAEGTSPPADLNATADYKRHLARVLCRRALQEAVA